MVGATLKKEYLSWCQAPVACHQFPSQNTLRAWRHCAPGHSPARAPLEGGAWTDRRYTQARLRTNQYLWLEVNIVTDTWLD